MQTEEGLRKKLWPPDREFNAGSWPHLTPVTSVSNTHFAKYKHIRRLGIKQDYKQQYAQINVKEIKVQQKNNNNKNDTYFTKM